MTTHHAEEAHLLRSLLADAHSRVRELQTQVAGLVSALLTLSLSDRRRATGPHGEGRSEGERRRAGIHTTEPRKERRARVRLG
jgi:hypothetical protein